MRWEFARLPPTMVHTFEDELLPNSLFHYLDWQRSTTNTSRLMSTVIQRRESGPYAVTLRRSNLSSTKYLCTHRRQDLGMMVYSNAHCDDHYLFKPVRFVEASANVLRWGRRSAMVRLRLQVQAKAAFDCYSDTFVYQEEVVFSFRSKISAILDAFTTLARNHFTEREVASSREKWCVGQGVLGPLNLHHAREARFDDKLHHFQRLVEEGQGQEPRAGRGGRGLRGPWPWPWPLADRLWGSQAEAEASQFRAAP